MVRSLSALSPAPSSLGVVANDARKAKSQPSHTNLDWYIDIPVLAPEVQSTYRPLNEVPINYQGQQLFELDEIIGEHEIDHVLYYYGRWKQGFASRVRSFAFEVKISSDAPIVPCREFAGTASGGSRILL